MSNGSVGKDAMGDPMRHVLAAVCADRDDARKQERHQRERAERHSRTNVRLMLERDQTRHTWQKEMWCFAERGIEMGRELMRELVRDAIETTAGDALVARLRDIIKQRPMEELVEMFNQAFREKVKRSQATGAPPTE